LNLGRVICIRAGGLSGRGHEVALRAPPSCPPPLVPVLAHIGLSKLH